MSEKFIFRGYLLLFIALLLSCKPHYDLIKSNRIQYAVNDSIAPDSALIKAYLPYKNRVDAEMSATIGTADQALTKASNGESLLGNFFADACLSEALRLDNNIDFAIPSTTGGLRNNLPKGNVSLFHIFELMPFENELLVLKLKGSSVKELLRFIATSGGQPVSGLKMKIDNNAAKDVIIQNHAFDESKIYHVLTSDYIAGGGDNTFGMSDPLEKKVLGLKVRDALIQYIKRQTAAGKTINATLDGRIIKN